MTHLHKSLQSWNTEQFKRILTQELQALESTALPLHLATTQGGYVNKDNLGITLLSATEDQFELKIKAGLFFTEIIGGCNCHDDPIEANAYCQLEISINKGNASTRIILLEA